MAPPLRICSDKPIRHGDVVFVDIGAAWGGYVGDMARTVICGKASDEQKKIYTAVYEGLKAGIAEMRPGRTNKDSADALIKAADKYGLGGRFLSLFIGHGVGMGANEPPYIGETLPGAPTYEFKPGMVFALETFWPSTDGWSAARIEEEIVVTETGHEVITRFPAEELLVAGAHYFTVDGPLPTLREHEAPPSRRVVEMVEASARSERVEVKG